MFRLPSLETEYKYQKKEGKNLLLLSLWLDRHFNSVNTDSEILWRVRWA